MLSYHTLFNWFVPRISVLPGSHLKLACLRFDKDTYICDAHAHQNMLWVNASPILHDPCPSFVEPSPYCAHHEIICKPIFDGPQMKCGDVHVVISTRMNRLHALGAAGRRNNCIIVVPLRPHRPGRMDSGRHALLFTCTRKLFVVIF